MNSLLRRYLAQPFGFAFEVLDLNRFSEYLSLENEFTDSRKLPNKRGNGVEGQHCRWLLDDFYVTSGWYMVEVVHSSKTIGCVLALRISNNKVSYLRLTSKSICKRILYLDTNAECCEVSVDHHDCQIDRISLSPLSSKFAAKRMHTRLANRSCPQRTKISRVELYSEYERHVHDGIVIKDYLSPMLTAKNSAKLASTTHISRKRFQSTQPELYLFTSSPEHLVLENRSIDASCEYAKHQGWKVEWCNSDQAYALASQHVNGVKAYVMNINPLAEYRFDIFHEMLSSVREDTILAYADHDYYDARGGYHDPALKPEWNPEYLLHTNYILMPWMILIDRLERFLSTGLSVDLSMDRVLIGAAFGWQNAIGKDIVSKDSSRSIAKAVYAAATRALYEHEVQRIPEVLSSLPLNEVADVDSHVDDSCKWRELISETFDITGCNASLVEDKEFNRFYIQWPLPDTLPRVDIIIPTRDKYQILERCINSILEKSTYANYRILIVDNNSQCKETHRYFETIKEYQNIELLRYSGIFNYSAINNFAVSRSNADILILLNNDTEVISASWLEELVSQAIRPETGCVGAKLFYANNRIQHGGVILGISGIAAHAHRYCRGTERGYRERLIVPQNISAVTAACLAVRKTVFLEAGGFDEKHLAVAWNDVDLCLKVKGLGYRNIWTPHAQLYHHEGLSRGVDETKVKIDRTNRERGVMLDRWGLHEYNDPAYHPNLTQEHEGFGLGIQLSSV